MKYLRFLVGLFLAHCLILPATVSGQEKVVDLPKLLKLALQKNAEVQIQSGEARIASLNHRQAVSTLLPQLDVDGGYFSASGQKGVPDFIAANAIDEKLAWLSVQQTIFSAEKYLSVSGTGIERRRQKLASRRLDQAVILRVVEAYFSVLKARGRMKVFEQNLRAFEALYEQSEQLFESGIVREFDVRKTHTEYLLQKNILARSRNDYRSLLNLLKELVGLPIEEPLSINDFPYQNTTLDSLNVYREIALRNRPELLLNQVEKIRFAAEKRAALLQRLPQVDVNFFYGWDTGMTLRSQNRGWQIFLNVRMPLWHWGGQLITHQIASIRYKQSQIRFEQLRRKVVREVIDAYQDCLFQTQQLQVMQESRTEAAKAMGMARFGYQEGTVTNLEVINAQKLLAESNIQYLLAQYDFYIAKARLFQTAGKLEEDLTWVK